MTGAAAPHSEAGRNGPIGILCFGGDLPVGVASRAEARGHTVFAIAFQGFASPDIERFPHVWVKLGQISRFFRVLRKQSIRRIVIVGALTRPRLRDLSLDWKGFHDIPHILRALRAGGDDSALRKAVRYFEDHGLTVMAVSEVAPELLAGEGRLGQIAPGEKEIENMRIGSAVLDALSSFDVGQACIVLDGRPVAIEGAEGTDGMIMRIGELRRSGRLRVSGRRGVVVKAAKRGQDLRVDLPTIGPRTIQLAADAQLAGVAIEAGKALIADRDACLALADRLGLFVVGVVQRMNMPPVGSLKLAIVAGEASGDALGASLVRTLRARGVDVSLSGVGGSGLEQVGLHSLFPQSDIAIMGIAAVVARAPLLMRRISETARAIAAGRPDLLLTIDSPDFTLRVGKKVRAAAPAIPILHWVCPSVWAWRPWRARKMKPHVDRIMCLLPFEPEELRKLSGPPGVYVGHPLIEHMSDFRPASSSEVASRADAQAPEILLLPGSRRSEAARLLEIFGEAVALVAAKFPEARFTLPAVDHLRPLIEGATGQWRTPVSVVAGTDEKLAAFRRARAAVAASGTVTLELALAAVPTVAVYRVAEWEAFIARRLIRVPSVLLPNLILGRNAMPELLQENCTPSGVASALTKLIDKTPERAAQLTAFEEVAARMRGDGAAPNAHAADEALRLLAEGKSPDRRQSSGREARA